MSYGDGAVSGRLRMMSDFEIAEYGIDIIGRSINGQFYLITEWADWYGDNSVVTINSDSYDGLACERQEAVSHACKSKVWAKKTTLCLRDQCFASANAHSAEDHSLPEANGAVPPVPEKTRLVLPQDRALDGSANPVAQASRLHFRRVCPVCGAELSAKPTWTPLSTVLKISCAIG
jgi:hypothetical protein